MSMRRKAIVLTEAQGIAGIVGRYSTVMEKNPASVDQGVQDFFHQQ